MNEFNNIAGNFQSFLFYGTDLDFIYKKSVIFSKNLLCKASKDPKCTCQSCSVYKVKKNELIQHPDLLAQDFEWSESSRSGEGVKGIRNILHQLNLSPLWGNKKVVILRYADYFNKESANALLKSLEEPTKSSYIILLARDINNVLPTITSRTFNYEFQSESSDLSPKEKKQQQEWEKILHMTVNDRFKLAEKLAKSDKSIYFLNFLEDHIYKLNRQDLQNNKNISSKALKDRAMFLKKLGETRTTITHTNANKRLALECVLMDIEKAGI